MKPNLEQNAKRMAEMLRRLMIYQKLMIYEVQGLKGAEYIPNEYKQRMNGFAVSIHSLMSYQRSKTNKETWDAILEDLDKDKIHDIGLLVNEVVNIENIGDIVEIINKSKTKVEQVFTVIED